MSYIFPASLINRNILSDKYCLPPVNYKNQILWLQKQTIQVLL